LWKHKTVFGCDVPDSLAHVCLDPDFSHVNDSVNERLITDSVRRMAQASFHLVHETPRQGLKIERIAWKSVTKESFHERYVLTNTPVVIEGLISDWPALKAWQDPQYLLDKMGPDTKVTVEFVVRYNPSATIYLRATSWARRVVHLPCWACLIN
jgi:hypothetical protein